MNPCETCIESGSYILDWFDGGLFRLFQGALRKGNHFHLLLMPASEVSSKPGAKAR
jgi:hypothetical protein